MKTSKTILITGATGFLGGYLVNYFSNNKGYRIFATGRKETLSINPNNTEYFRWDISESLYHLETPIDIVIHCAGSVTHWADYEQMYKSNVLGTENVLKSFPNAKFIHISTASLYGSNYSQNLIKETDTIVTKEFNSYQRTKYEAEKMVMSKSNNYLIFRPHIIYGKGDTTIQPRLIRAKKDKIKKFIVLGNGTNRISLTYINNFAKALELGINSHIKNEIFNITDQTNDTCKNVLEEFKNVEKIDYKNLYIPIQLAYVLGFILEIIYTIFVIKKEPIITKYVVEQMTKNQILDISKIQTQLGYQTNDNYKNQFQNSYGS